MCLPLTAYHCTDDGVQPVNNFFSIQHSTPPLREGTIAYQYKVPQKERKLAAAIWQ